MAPKPKPWFRLYTETTRDRKIRRMKPEHRWLWVTVLSLARQSPRHGYLLVSDGSPIDDTDLADEAALTVTQVRKGLAAFRTSEMVELVDGVLHVTNWDARQFESDLSTQRATKARSKNADATPDEATMQRPIDVDATAPENREQRTEPLEPASQRPAGTPTARGKQAAVVIARRQIAGRVASGDIANPAVVATKRAHEDLWPVLGAALTALAESNPAAGAEALADLADVDPLTGSPSGPAGRHGVPDPALVEQARLAAVAREADTAAKLDGFRAVEPAQDALGAARAARAQLHPEPAT